MLKKQTIKDIDLNGKTVLLRADYNVPLDENDEISDEYRLTKSLPTLKHLIASGAKTVVISHLGRPKNRDEKLSLKVVAEKLSRLLDKEIAFCPELYGTKRQEIQNSLKSGQVMLLENLRYDEREGKNDPEFARQLAGGIDVFVQDGFGVVHRQHASTDAITKYLPAVAGLLVEKEYNVISSAMENPDRPLMALLGGAKIGDKIGMLDRLIDIADVVAVGGGMSNTFLLAEGMDVGRSLTDRDDIELARTILKKARQKAKTTDFVFYVPQDGVVSTAMGSKYPTRIVDWGTHVISEIENYPKSPPKSSGIIKNNEKILDIGPFSGAFIAGSMQLAGTVIWNGTMGVTEVEPLTTATGPYSHGTELVVEAMLGQFGHRPKTIVGGGDTVGYVESRGLVEMFDHVSTGGGASMDLMSGKKLPGVEALADKR